MSRTVPLMRVAPLAIPLPDVTFITGENLPVNTMLGGGASSSATGPAPGAGREAGDDAQASAAMHSAVAAASFEIFTRPPGVAQPSSVANPAHIVWALE
jgi:hypothetical protein